MQFNSKRFNNKKHNLKWSSVSKRERRCPLISDSLKVMIQEWIIKHPSIVEFSIENDTILVRGNITGKQINRVRKYLIQVSIRELHNDLTRSKNEGSLSEVWKE